MDSLLTVSGLIANPRQYDLASLAGLEPQAEDELFGMVRLRRIIEASRPEAEADHVTAVSSDGSYSASIPLAEATRLGEVHTHDEKGKTSLRLLVPGGATLCWNVKGLGLLRVTAGPEPDSLPEVLTH